ncbi:hypothetical protein GOODEAATRI_004264 [Goodea atripinnis]|uniref:GDP/GTP exchange factor Sec2 N-terminal domain-containing protein n=1 Tax=Goodea atripinnis TaxID=208336 RepID=A0ABV0PKX1_9TELE
MEVVLFSASMGNFDPKSMACSGGQSNAETLEGFHEVNLASPTTPDLQNQTEQRTPARHNTAPTSVYRTHSLGPPPGGLPTSLRADQLPTQPVYSTPRHSHNGSVPGLEAELAEGSFLSGEDGDECSALSDSLSRLRSPSVMEVREKGYERLKDELAKAQRELLLKDEECERLSKVRDQLGQELEELTASLFQEAHKMVREANVKQANAEKQLKEALGKIDVLQAEVQALKTLVLSSPTSPVAELPSAGATKTPFKKGHSRNKSTSSAMLGTQPDPTATQPIVRECREVGARLRYQPRRFQCGDELANPVLFLKVDSQLFSEFKAWKEAPTLDRSCSFLERVYREDIFPCLTFNKSEITAVCNFFTYIRYIHQGLVKQQDAEQMFWEVMQLRREMSFAKLGYYKDQL